MTRPRDSARPFGRGAWDAGLSYFRSEPSPLPGPAGTGPAAPARPWRGEPACSDDLAERGRTR